MTTPPFGLLLDVDGPIASPVTRAVSTQSIIDDLVTLSNNGIPIAFNTGRSDVFLRDVVAAPLSAAGLHSDTVLYGICEKGGVWFRMPAGTVDDRTIAVDDDFALPSDYVDEIRDVIANEFSAAMFFDETKRSMISAEQHVGTPTESYREAQAAFDEGAMRRLTERGIGVERESDVRPAADGSVSFRVDPTIISTDIESRRVGKDVGAERFLTLLAEDDRQLPDRWYTVGDSRSDYAMADWLHAQGHTVAHVDVRPADGVPEKPYEIVTYGDAIHDDAGALFLRDRVRELG